MRELWVKPGIFNDVSQGIRRTQVWVRTSRINSVRIGEHLVLLSRDRQAIVNIATARFYTSIQDLLNGEDWKQLMPAAPTVNKAHKILRRQFGNLDERGLRVVEYELVHPTT